MRAAFAIIIVFGLGVFASPVPADELSDDFRRRIEAALAIDDEAGRSDAVAELFYSDALDEFSQGLANRVIGIVAKLQGRDVSFAPLPPDTELVNILDGYEYRPNIEPLGHVVFTDPAAEPGNETKALYGRHPTEPRYMFPLTSRRLVNPDAPPDRQLQILTIGMDHPPITFAGWCDIALSNNTVKRISLDDQKLGNQTRIMRGQSIEACEVTNTSGRGALSLRLYVDDDEIFMQHIETPETTISYRKP